MKWRLLGRLFFQNDRGKMSVEEPITTLCVDVMTAKTGLDLLLTRAK